MATYDYDLFVIGGGSGGMAASKKASDLGAKVAVADFVKPSPAGTTWGLGGTCVNVGCIPKKLMHHAALFRESMADAHGLGWDTRASHSWEEMVTKVNSYIKSLNWGSKTELRSKNVTYFNSFATFEDAHTLKLDNGKGKVEKVTAKYILIACGGRPNLGGYPGVEECCISSDDIFWKKKAPGKTLVVGASYIALECAGFLAAFGVVGLLGVLRRAGSRPANCFPSTILRAGRRGRRGLRWSCRRLRRISRCSIGRISLSIALEV